MHAFFERSVAWYSFTSLPFPSFSLPVCRFCGGCTHVPQPTMNYVYWCFAFSAEHPSTIGCIPQICSPCPTQHHQLILFIEHISATISFVLDIRDDLAKPHTPAFTTAPYTMAAIETSQLLQVFGTPAGEQPHMFSGIQTEFFTVKKIRNGRGKRRSAISARTKS